ncbi:MAG: trehalose-phosphatase [Vicinamibacterales bacterium]|nr:trehalose-phosphatase [Vicinamibacterales bacterium]
MLEDVQRALEGRPRDARFVVLSDFDGTLAEFHDDPAAPVLTPARRALLTALAVRPDITVGLISGRRLNDLRDRTTLPANVYHAGLHGLELAIEDRRWQHPDLRETRDVVAELVARIRARVGDVPGLRLEEKGVALTVHVRGVDPAIREAVLARAEACADPWLDAGQLKRLVSSQAREYLPNIPWNKGDALRWIARDVRVEYGRPPWVVFLGDDVTDEDAFVAIDRGMAIVVGPRPSVARWRLRDPAEVEQLLRWIAAEETG